MTTRTRALGAIAGAAALAAVASGCSTPADALGGAPPVEAAALAVASAPLAAADAAPVIVDAGAEPRQVLARPPVVGTTQTLQITQGGSHAFEVEGDSLAAPTPQISIDLDLTVVAAGDGGGPATVELVVRAATASTSGDAVVDQHVAPLVAGLAGSAWSTSITAGGGVVGTEPVLDVDAASSAMVLGWLERTPLSVADPLPSVPLGVGASWTVTDTAVDLGWPVSDTRTYSITSIDEATVVADVTRTLTWQAGERDGTRVLTGSRLVSAGTAWWARDGIVGAVSLSGEGTVSYRLGTGTLIQRIGHQFSTQSSVSTPPPPTTAPPTTAPPTTAPPTTAPPTTAPSTTPPTTTPRDDDDTATTTSQPTTTTEP